VIDQASGDEGKVENRWDVGKRYRGMALQGTGDGTSMTRDIPAPCGWEHGNTWSLTTQRVDETPCRATRIMIQRRSVNGQTREENSDDLAREAQGESAEPNDLVGWERHEIVRQGFFLGGSDPSLVVMPR
jgi:hypothetical protein